MLAEAPQPFRFFRVTAAPDCTMACGYCNPKRRFNPEMMSTQDILETVQVGIEEGIDPVVHLTGGEPSKRKDIVDLVNGLSRTGVRTIEMTTNGIPFYRLADKLSGAGLTGVNISMDTFNPDKFREITGVAALPLVLQAINNARRLFPNKVALNMVVMKTNLQEIPEFIDFSVKTGVMVRFCELTPNGPYMADNPGYFDQNHVSKQEILDTLQNTAPLGDASKERIDQQNAHSEYFTLGDDFSGITVGIIAPYSNGWPCPGPKCVRLRIGPTSANSCVIYPDKTLLGLSLELKRGVIRHLIQERRYQERDNLFPPQHRPAYLIYRFGLDEQESVDKGVTANT